MIRLSLSETASAISGQLNGSDSVFKGVSVDSRTLKSGQLFIAIKGEKNDGHSVLEDVKNKGGVGAIVNSLSTRIKMPQIVVKDSIKSLGDLAHFWRKNFTVKVIGITGSVGKTTVKEMLGTIIKQVGNPLVSEGNYNNEIGVPLTLLKLSNEINFVVLEMGAAKPGDIKYLSELALHDVGIITKCSPAHLSGFGNLETIARTKGEILALPKDGVAILNKNDAFFPFWSAIVKKYYCQILSFGDGADVWAGNIVDNDYGMSFDLNIFEETMRTTLNFLGRHNIDNALAAATAARALGISPKKISQGLMSAVPMNGRMQLKKGKGNYDVIDDSYNSNPASLAAAMLFFSSIEGPKWLVLGDMKELGEKESSFHFEALSYANTLGFQKVFTIGPCFKKAGKEIDISNQHFESNDNLLLFLQESLRNKTSKVSILFKGSRAMELNKIVDFLVEDNR